MSAFSPTSRHIRPFVRASVHLFITIAIYCTFAVSTADAATYYVDDVNGSDSNPGTSEQPWKTLNRTYTWYVGQEPKVQEGDTVLFRNGNYGQFMESTNTNPGTAYLFYRNNWITYKAASGHTPVLDKVYIRNQDKWAPIEHGRSYLVFDGFGILDGLNFQYTSYAQIRNCNITTKTESYDGLHAPYIKNGKIGIGIIYGHYITVERNEISHIFRGISATDSSDNIVLKNNVIHRIGEDGITCPVQHVVVADNHIYDINKYYTGVDIQGTLTGAFNEGEAVTQDGTGAQGTYYAKISSSHEIWETTTAHFQTAANGGGAITGQTSGAVLSNINYVEPQHTDGIAMHSSLISDVNVTGNIIHGGMWDGIKLATYTDGIVENVIIANNLIYDTAGYAMYTGAEPLTGPGGTYRNINIYNNTFYAQKLHLRNTVKIENMYNNIIMQLKIDANKNAWVVNHGNNIFRENPNGLGGPSYPFAANGTELINYNVDTLFVNAASNDFNLAPNSAAINFGNSSYAPAADILGKSRVGAPDAGCYEYVGAQSLPEPKNLSPKADAGPDQTLTDSDDSGSEQVTLDGSGSSDPDGNITSYVWTEGGSQIATGVRPTVSLPVGQHIITLQVTDNDGLTDTDTVTVTIDLELGLVGHFKFDEGNGVTANDSSGFGTTGRLVNGPARTAQGEISFDGNNDAVEVATANLNVNRGTITLWAYPNAFSKTRHYLFGHATQPADNRIQLFCNASGSLGVGLGNNSSLKTDIQNLNIHEWYHITLVWDRGNYVTYVDGTQKAAGTYSGLSSLQTYADIGNNGDSSGRTEGFDGLIDEVRLYDKPLTTDEIADLALAFLPIGDKTVAESVELSFPIRTKSGVIVDISDNNLPSVPTLAANVFRWTPDYDDAGTYEVEFTASGQTGEDFEKVTVTVLDTQQDEPVGYWKFDETSGNIAADSSVTGNTGYLKNGLSWDSGKINGAVVFSIPNDAVELQTTNLNPKSGTIAMWVYVQRQTLSRHYLFSHADESLKNRIQLYLKYGNLCLGLGDSYETRTNIQQLQNRRWYHIAMTWGPTTYKVYVDGLLKASGTYPGLTKLSDHADIGNYCISRDKALNGKIDDVRIYNRVLDTSEIARLAVGDQQIR